ncbi:MAG TPA: VWA domain-containing protein [Bryobacteraceae bacterium]|jgi:Ca-activated chloride channel family protein|nr:VWA domain-containing protein [Bryobacteraceae bacterium]
MRFVFQGLWRRVGGSRAVIATGCLALACGALTFAQNSDVRVSITPRVPTRLDARVLPSGVIRSDVNRVFIPTTVTDSSGRPVQGLRKQDFRLWEDGVEQDLSEFFTEEGPISVGVILDISGSVKNKLDQAKQAVRQFLRLSAQADEFFLVTFNDRPQLIHSFTTSPNDIEADFAAAQPRGWTALYDAIFLGINHMKRANLNRRVLLILSDGGDNNSRYSEGEIRSLVREADVRIFSISMESHTPVLDKLANESGGRAYQVHDLDNLPEAAAALSAEAHAEYILGFTPPDRQRDGKYHSVKVQVLQYAGEQPLHVSWRRGYYGPLE